MERIEIAEDGRIAEWVAAVERGDEVVITRDGAVVAEVRTAAMQVGPAFHPGVAAAIAARQGSMRNPAGHLVSEMRDMDPVPISPTGLNLATLAEIHSLLSISGGGGDLVRAMRDECQH